MQKTYAGWLLIPLVIVLLFTRGQAQNPPGKLPVIPTARVPAEPLSKRRDGTRLPPQVQPLFYSAYRAMNWLKLANKPDGRFVYGFLPALRVPMEGDNFISQAGATFALARASRYFGDEGSAAVARQAALSLLMDTAVDARAPSIRYTTAPSAALNRLASHGLLILAIHDLGAPGGDLLEQAGQLCNYLRNQQRADGSLVIFDGEETTKRALTDLDCQSSGVALHAVIRSYKQQPAEWKTAMLRKGLAYYQSAWQANKTVDMVVSHTPAYAEAYVQTREPAYADAVFAMNDWLISLQYSDEHDPLRKQWIGGFPYGASSKQDRAPDISSALPAESLAEACRVARQAGDLQRLKNYERALLLDLHFLMSLQYTSKKVEHFVENYRPAILGAFYGAHQDGNLRLDYTQHPLCAMVQYLDAVIE